MNIAAAVLLLYGLALALLAVAGRSGIASEFLLDVLFGATRWTAAAAMVFTTVYLLWTGVAERLLTFRYVCGALLVAAAFGATWVTMLRAAGVQLAGMPTADAVWMLSPILLPLTASVLAPWSLSRIRQYIEGALSDSSGYVEVLTNAETLLPALPELRPSAAEGQVLKRTYRSSTASAFE